MSTNRFLTYEILKTQFAKLTKRQQAEEKIVNQPVMIRDILVKTHFNSLFGEKNPLPKTQQKGIHQRLRAHIHCLFSLANTDHRTRNHTKQHGCYQLKKGKENSVTRLSLPEFSLYTPTPLSEDDFSSLCQEIEIMATTLEPNVHILLSSFAVKNKDKKIMNVCLFVEGGHLPKLHTIIKNTVSGKDVNYKRREHLLSQYEKDTLQRYHADASLSQEGLVINYGSVFEITTLGGACYTQSIDICWDHQLAHSKELLLRRLQHETDANSLFPEQIEQCVTSCVTTLRPLSILSDTVLHVDPTITTDQTPEKPNLSGHKLQRVIPLPSSSTITNRHNGYIMTNPYFGADCRIELFKERPAGRYLPELQPAIKKYNLNIQQRRLYQSPLGHNNTPHVFFSKKHFPLAIPHYIEQLQTACFALCEPSFWQKFFKTQEYNDKLRTKEIIKKHIDQFKTKQLTDTTLETDIKNLIVILTHSVDTTKGSFAKSILKQITETAETMGVPKRTYPS